MYSTTMMTKKADRVAGFERQGRYVPLGGACLKTTVQVVNPWVVGGESRSATDAG